MKNILSSLVKEFIKVVIIVAVAVPTIALFAAWTGPTGAPPTNNADAPVNVGIATQQKNGNLAVNSFRSFYDTYLATDGGNVGIGTMSPQAKLDVDGGIKIADNAILEKQIQIKGGNPGPNKVLTSDNVSGLASWKTPSGGGGGGGFDCRICARGFGRMDCSTYEGQEKCTPYMSEGGGSFNVTRGFIGSGGTPSLACLRIELDCR